MLTLSEVMQEYEIPQFNLVLGADIAEDAPILVDLQDQTQWPMYIYADYLVNRGALLKSLIVSGIRTMPVGRFSVVVLAEDLERYQRYLSGTNHTVALYPAEDAVKAIGFVYDLFVRRYNAGLEHHLPYVLFVINDIGCLPIESSVKLNAMMRSPRHLGICIVGDYSFASDNSYKVFLSEGTDGVFNIGDIPAIRPVLVDGR